MALNDNKYIMRLDLINTDLGMNGTGLGLMGNVLGFIRDGLRLVSTGTAFIGRGQESIITALRLDDIGLSLITASFSQ